MFLNWCYNASMNLQVGVKAFLRNTDGKYLLIKRSALKYPDITNCWDIVGGRINPGTTLIENLKREVMEETQLILIGEPKLLYAQDIILGNEKHVVRLTYITEVSGEPILDREENTEFVWLKRDELLSQEHLDSYTKEIILKGLL